MNNRISYPRIWFFHETRHIQSYLEDNTSKLERQHVEIAKTTCWNRKDNVLYLRHHTYGSIWPFRGHKKDQHIMDGERFQLITNRSTLYTQGLTWNHILRYFASQLPNKGFGAWQRIDDLAVLIAVWNTSKTQHFVDSGTHVTGK